MLSLGSHGEDDKAMKTTQRRRVIPGAAAGAALLLIAALAAACTSSSASPSASAPAGASAASSAGSSDAVSGATASATGTVPASAAATTPAARVAWVTGQTVKQDVLTSPGTGWVLTTTNLWQTINDGVSWANAYPHGLIASKIRGLGAFDANHAFLAAADVHTSTTQYYVWRTTDAGQTWRYVALPPTPHDPGVPADPSNPRGPDPQVSFDYIDANNAFLWLGMPSGTDGMNNYVYETTNGGATWTAKTYTFPDPGLTSPSTYRLQFETAQTGVAEYENVISSTTTGWGHWTHQTLSADNYSYAPISFLSSTWWAADGGLESWASAGARSGASVIYHYSISSDQGASWVDYTSSVPGIAGVSGATVKFLTPLKWIGTDQTAGGAYGLGTSGPSQTIYTIDGGAHWALEGPQPFDGSIATFVDSTHGWSGPNYQVATAKLYSTADDGRHWRLLTP
jgi:hypothetical protein